MNELKFSYSWNNKLSCKAFTTLRLSNRFKVGETIKVTTPDKTEFLAQIIDKKSFYLSEITNFIAYIDTGYDKEECKKILMKMYKNKGVDWFSQKIHFYLVKKI